MAHLIAIGARQRISSAIMANCHADLLNQHFVEIRRLLAEKIFQIGLVQLGLGEIAREKY